MNNKPRNSHFELLRIIAMVMVISSHFAVHGIQICLTPEKYQLWASGSLLNKFFVTFLNPGGEIGVALFFMITGYFQISKNRYSLRKVMTSSLFYGWFSVMLFFLLRLSGVSFPQFSIEDIVRFLSLAFLNPTSGGLWWFLAAYMALLIISPLLNNFLRSLSKKGYVYTLLLFLLLGYALTFVGAAQGTMRRAIFFYGLGAFCKLYPESGRRFPRLALPLFFACWVFSALLWYQISSILSDTNAPIIMLLLAKFDLIFFSVVCVPICAFNLFRYFERKPAVTNPVINQIAATTLGVYLLHDSFIVRNLIWYILLDMQTLYQQTLFPLYGIAIILAIFGGAYLFHKIYQYSLEPWLEKVFEHTKELFRQHFQKESA